MQRWTKGRRLAISLDGRLVRLTGRYQNRAFGVPNRFVRQCRGGGGGHARAVALVSIIVRTCDTGCGGDDRMTWCGQTDGRSRFADVANTGWRTSAWRDRRVDDGRACSLRTKFSPCHRLRQPETWLSSCNRCWQRSFDSIFDVKTAGNFQLPVVTFRSVTNNLSVTYLSSNRFESRHWIKQRLELCPSLFCVEICLVIRIIMFLLLKIKVLILLNSKTGFLQSCDCDYYYNSSTSYQLSLLFTRTKGLTDNGMISIRKFRY